MAYKYKIFFILTPLVVLLDFWTKSMILNTLAIGETVTVIPQFFDLVHVRNAGAAFGMLASMDPNFRAPFFYGISFVASCVLVYCFLTLERRDRFYPWPLGLVSAGVIGNFIDRVRYGSVVDFVSLHVGDKMVSGVELRWPAFNAADSAITISMILLIAAVFKKR
ncbi:MAG: signal peptidase II [Deltaproteobacteria bacterium]|nr:signal peptidase II [Deltaproteobacteria bacterium]